jgi:hypothetical protein
MVLVIIVVTLANTFILHLGYQLQKLKVQKSVLEIKCLFYSVDHLL